MLSPRVPAGVGPAGQTGFGTSMPGSRRVYALSLLTCMAFAIRSGLAGGPDTWVPARWQGGPLELQRRAENKTLPSDPAVRESIGKWYDPATLDLLKGTPINCLLVTWGTGCDPETDKQQQDLVKSFAREARTRGISILGLVRSGSDPSSVSELTAGAGLDGLVIEGDSTGIDRYVAEVRRTLRERNSAAVVFPLIAWEKLQSDPDSPVLAAADAVAPGVQELGEGADASPSSEPWIDSNIWLVRSIISWCAPRPVWLGEQVAADATPGDYERAIADAAAGGGRWILSLIGLRNASSRDESPARDCARRLSCRSRCLFQPGLIRFRNSAGERAGTGDRR